MTTVNIDISRSPTPPIYLGGLRVGDYFMTGGELHVVIRPGGAGDDEISDVLAFNLSQGDCATFSANKSDFDVVRVVNIQGSR